MSEVIKRWHEVLSSGELKGLNTLLAPRCIFYSPVVFKAQEGRTLTKTYLQAAYLMFRDTGFHYVKEIVGEEAAVLEFNATVDGVFVDGIDMISWNESGKITEFKVMLRPYKAIDLVKEKMLEQLSALNTIDKAKIRLGTIWDNLAGS